MSAYVNCWELITTVAGHDDLPNSNACKAIQDLCGMQRHFANEFTFEVSDDGVWTVSFFSCYDKGNGPSTVVTVQVNHDGEISVNRKAAVINGVCDERTVTF